MKKKFKTKEVEECLWEGETDNFKLVEEDAWINEGKDEYCKIIFEELSTKKTFMYIVSRTGPPFTDWIYSFEWESDEIECSEVEKAEVIKYEWKVL